MLNGSLNQKSQRWIAPAILMLVFAGSTAVAQDGGMLEKGALQKAAAGTAIEAPSDQPPASDDAAMADTGAPAVDEIIRVMPQASSQMDQIQGESENLINVTVENETLENVVNMFTRISGANIVTTTEDLRGTVTVNLRGVQWKPALGAILAIHDLALSEMMPGSGVYSIVPKPPADSEPLVVETLFLSFTTVPEMKPLLSSMLSTVSNATISTFPSRNAMVIKTTEPNMREIRAMIQEMDVPGKQVVVETKFMELSDEASKKLGIRWDSLDALELKLQAGPFGYTRDIERGEDRLNSSVYSDSRSQSESSSSGSSASSINQQLFDIDGNQVPPPSDVQITDLTPDILTDNVPGDPNYLVQVISEAATTRNAGSDSASARSQSRNISDQLGREVFNTFNKAITETQAAVLDVASFDLVLSALKKTDGVQVISNPKIIVASGSEDAFFSVGEREPIIKTEVERGTEESPGDLVTAELDTSVNTDYIKEGYLETGIQLKVVPTVKTEDLIEAAIEPRLIRRMLPDKVVGNNSWPRISVKEIKTRFTLRSGQTIAIGGLTDSSDDKKTSKVPFLGDLPLLGKYLFSHTADVTRQVETIIFVTLSLADPQGLFQEAGIPQQAELVHKELIRETERRKEFEAQLHELKEASRIKAAAEEQARVDLLESR